MLLRMEGDSYKGTARGRCSYIDPHDTFTFVFASNNWQALVDTWAKVIDLVPVDTTFSSKGRELGGVLCEVISHGGTPYCGKDILKDSYTKV